MDEVSFGRKNENDAKDDAEDDSHTELSIKDDAKDG